jgi:hypothetical protein
MNPSLFYHGSLFFPESTGDELATCCAVYLENPDGDPKSPWVNHGLTIGQPIVSHGNDHDLNDLGGTPMT